MSRQCRVDPPLGRCVTQGSCQNPPGKYLPRPSETYEDVSTTGSNPMYSGRGLRTPSRQ